MRKKLKKKAIMAPAKSAPAKPKVQVNPAKKQMLHIISNPFYTRPFSQQFADGTWQEVRLDAQAAPANPSFTRMNGIPDGIFHAVCLGAYNLERLYSHEVPLALKEIHRILRLGSVAFIHTIDMQRVAELVGKGNLERPLYHSPAGIITALDVFYGYRQALEEGNLSGCPHTAFTANSLADKLAEAGFGKVQVTRDGLFLTAAAQKLVQAEGVKPHITILGNDVNKMMRTRDELDKEPEIWKGLDWARD